LWYITPLVTAPHAEIRRMAGRTPDHPINALWATCSTGKHVSDFRYVPARSNGCSQGCALTRGHGVKIDFDCEDRFCVATV
jgi:hypothetical protein